tara:strand:- start:6188 stop:6796 length:609 start_codon:yes stop_codon:yes gene_type:complete
MAKPLYIEHILKTYSITEYLESRGLKPTTQASKRDCYPCPLPDHDDSTPSFFVFLQGGYEQYKCFGCGATGDIINLYCALESTTLTEAIKHFASDLDIEDQTIMDYLADNLLDTEEDYGFSHLANLVIKINRASYDYLVQVDFDIEELRVIEKVLEKLDELAHSMNIPKLQEMYEFITEEGIPSRHEIFLNRKEERILNAAR